MLATPWAAPFVDPEWAFEVKWDGVRTLLQFDGFETSLRSRNGNDVTATYPELGWFHAPTPVILDGEVMALDDAGRPSFGRLQERMNLSSPNLVAQAMQHTPITYMVFDILYHGGSVVDLPWSERRALLAAMNLEPPLVVSDAIAEDPTGLWSFVEQRNLEGIVAKRTTSRYVPGARSQEWRKITTSGTVRAVVGGFTEGDRGRSSTFGALLLGLWSDDGLRWIGSVGTGFSDAELGAIREALDQMTMERSPFLPDDGIPKRATWVFPQLVALVEFKEWTKVGRLRAPSFKGFTDDPPGAQSFTDQGPRSG